VHGQFRGVPRYIEVIKRGYQVLRRKGKGKKELGRKKISIFRVIWGTFR
jgi:hypothetical protein